MLGIGKGKFSKLMLNIGKGRILELILGIAKTRSKLELMIGIGKGKYFELMLDICKGRFSELTFSIDKGIFKANVRHRQSENIGAERVFKPTFYFVFHGQNSFFLVLRYRDQSD